MQVLLSGIAMRLLYRSLVILLCLCCGVISSGSDIREMVLGETLSIDPLLSSYLEKGCTLKCSIQMQDGKPGIDGGFEIRNQEGRVIVEGLFLRDRFEGDLKTYAANGTLVALERYRNGVRSGDGIEWDSMGKLSLLTHYDIEGRKTGTERYFRDGIIAVEIDWEHGQPVEKRSFEGGKVIERLSGKEILRQLKSKIESSLQPTEAEQATPKRSP